MKNMEPPRDRIFAALSEVRTASLRCMGDKEAKMVRLTIDEVDKPIEGAVHDVNSEVYGAVLFDITWQH